MSWKTLCVLLQNDCNESYSQDKDSTDAPCTPFHLSAMLLLESISLPCPVHYLTGFMADHAQAESSPPQDRALKWQQIIAKGEFVITSHNEILLGRGFVWWCEEPLRFKTS